MKRPAWTTVALCCSWIGGAAAADRVPLGVLNAYQVFDPASNEPVINIALDRGGRAKMAEFSAKNVGRVAHLYVDDTVVAVPVIREPVLGGYLQVAKAFSVEEATEFAVRLRNETATLSIALGD